MELSHAQHTLAAEGTRLPTETLRGKELPQEKPAQLATSGEKLPKAALPEERLGAITLQGEGLPDACYSYDGSLEGMLSAIFASLTTPDHVTDIVEEGHIQPRLGQSVVPIPTSVEHATRLQNFLLRAGGRRAYGRVLYASLADDPDKAWAIRECVAFATTLPALKKCSRCPRHNLCNSLQSCPQRAGRRKSGTAGLDKHLENFAHPQCGKVATLSRHVANERHHMKQFLRFEHVESDLWFAQCNPNANVVPLLMSFFAARFSDQRFLIYDEAHKLAGIHDGHQSLLVPADHLETPPHRSADEALMRKAWKTFYHAATIEARYHPELRTQFMPKRLWQNILEVNEPLEYEKKVQDPALPPLSLPVAKAQTSAPLAPEIHPSEPSAPTTQPSKLPPSDPPPDITPVKSKEGMKLSEAQPPSCQK